MTDDLKVKEDEQKEKAKFRILGFRSGKKWKKVVASIGYIFVALIIFASFSGENDNKTTDKTIVSDQNKKVKNESVKESYTLKFEPNINTICSDGNITIEANINCPDGAIMQISLLSANFKEVYNDKPIVKDKKISSTFKLTNTDIKNYAGMITFQFNADSIKQPDNVKEIYGQRGEKLEGENAKEANFKDGIKGKIATITFDIPYPSKEVVENKKNELFNQMVNQIKSSSKGAILNVEHPDKGIIVMHVSNSWYLMSESEKQYFSEQMLKSFTQIIKNMDDSTCVLSIYDESQNEVASSKILGGMKIKR